MKTKLFFTTVIWGLLNNMMFAQPGSLDITFGTGGIVDANLGKGEDYLNATALQSDGKIVVAGYVNGVGNGKGAAIARYNSNGSIDNTFGIGGIVIINDGTHTIYSIDIQPDGKIVTGGEAFNVSGIRDNFCMTRHNSDGTLDLTFGTGGKIMTPVGYDDAICHAVTIQPDGKIVAAGEAHYGPKKEFAVVRYNSNGTLDATFGTNGSVITNIMSDHNMGCSIALQPDNKIIVAGWASVNYYTSYFAIVRYNSNGGIDSTFGTNGKMTTAVGSNSKAYSVTLQPDSKIIVAGSATVSSMDNFALVRYNSNGSIDSTFGANGKITTAMGINGSVASVALQPDGKIVAVGYTSDPVSYKSDFAVVRYHSTGVRDSTFGTGGIVTTDFGADFDDVASAVAIQPDGKIVAAGSARVTYAPWTVQFYDFAIARYNNNGLLDTTFGTDGMTTDNFATNDDRARSVALQSDGKIIAGGHANQDFTIARYDSNGSIDTTFGTGGIATTGNNEWRKCTSVAIQYDDKIIAAGNSSSFDFIVVRYNSNGTFDTTFGTGGIVTTDIIGLSGEYGLSAAIQSDGKIVVAGKFVLNGIYKIAVVRYHSNGMLDAAFGTGGIVYITPLSIVQEMYDRSIAIQQDGKIIIRTEASRLARLNSNGTLDNTFGTGGISAQPGGLVRSASVAMQFDGKIIMAGDDANGSIIVVRYNSDGTLDGTFGIGGEVSTSISQYGLAFSVALQQDGKIVLSGRTGTWYDFNIAIIRYNTNGSLDNTFGTGGIVTTDMNPLTTSYDDDEGYSVIIQPDGKIVVAGSTCIGGTFCQENLIIIRYIGDAATPVIEESGLTDNIIILYPNPSKGIFEVKSEKLEMGSIGIYNVMGAKVFQSSIHPFNNSTIDISNQPDGIYFLTIKTDKESFTQKLIISH